MTFIDISVMVFVAGGGAPLIDLARRVGKAAADGPVTISQHTYH